MLLIYLHNSHESINVVSEQLSWYLQGIDQKHAHALALSAVGQWSFNGILVVDRVHKLFLIVQLQSLSFDL